MLGACFVRNRRGCQHFLELAKRMGDNMYRSCSERLPLTRTDTMSPCLGGFIVWRVIEIIAILELLSKLSIFRVGDNASWQLNNLIN